MYPEGGMDYESKAPRGHKRGRSASSLASSSGYISKRAGFVRASRMYNRASLITPESKYFDTGINADVTSGANDWTATEVPCDNYVNASGSAAAYTDSALIPSAVGSGYGQVQGNRYKLKKVRVRGKIYRSAVSDQADIPTSTVTRLLLILDTQPNGAQAQGETIMQDVGAAETLFSYQLTSTSSVKRFRVLKDLILPLPVSAAGTDGASTNSVGYKDAFFNFSWTPKSPIEVSISSANSTPTIAGLLTHNVFLLLHTTGSAVTIQGAARAYYCD